MRPVYNGYEEHFWIGKATYYAWHVKGNTNQPWIFIL